MSLIHRSPGHSAWRPAPAQSKSYVSHAPRPLAESCPAPRPNGLAVAALIFGVIGASPLVLFTYGAVWLLAIGLGWAAYVQIKRSGGTQSGYSMAIAGMVLGAMGLCSLLFFLYFLGV